MITDGCIPWLQRRVHTSCMLGRLKHLDSPQDMFD
jgi:hypothetical protein